LDGGGERAGGAGGVQKINKKCVREIESAEPII
jgi:hypothetical protein